MASKKVPTMTANQALQIWAQQHPDERLEEVEEVGLQAQNPPIKTMTERIAQLANCKKLLISTNNIEEIQFLPPRIEILSIGRNMLKRLDKIEKAAATLQQLWMSYNNVKSFAPLVQCKRLRVLYAAHNNISQLSEIDRLGQLPNLEDIVLIGNPLYNDLNKKGTYRQEILRRLKKLQVLDGVALTQLQSENNNPPQQEPPSIAVSGIASRAQTPRRETTASSKRNDSYK
ncbi:dynein light chain [Histomonas meleagridis]|uniref:dynein light chain n=1 Tax=Histomonas meleagridis TaxID=135588 RepID=UPI00355ACA40|nr:dynein light chain [Histomonas meleagridis]KAH0803631.1 dynein light chain [Histomonas meleagridis]